MMDLCNLSLACRIYRLSGTVILIFLLVIGLLFFHFRESLYEARRQEVRHLVESGWHILEFHARQAARGDLTSEEARRRALDVIRNQRFEQENYFWVSDLTPRMVMHPLAPELEGKDLADERDPSGRPFFTEMAGMVDRDGEGFVEYLWPRPGESRAVEKISFVKGFPAWGWMIGAGFYADDIDRALLRLMLGTGGVLFLVTAGALLLVTSVAHSISVPMGRAVAMIEALENGDLDHRLRLDQADEVGRLARAMDAFADNLQYEILTAFDHLARGDFSFEAKGLIRDPLAQTNTRLNALVAELDRTVVQALESEARYFSLFRNNHAVMLLIDPATAAIVDANPSACVFYGYAHEQLLGMRMFELNTLSAEEVSRKMEAARSESRRQFHSRHRLATGEEREVEVYCGPIQVQGKELLYSIVHDITDRKRAEARVEYLAFHDPLTGLANRALLEDRLVLTLAHALRSNVQGALFFLDLDRFKVINDSLGHHAGDLLLQAAGSRLQTLVRVTDTVCRSGGDEFILLFPEIGGPTDAAHLAEKILASFTLPFVIEEREVFISPSIGISLYPGDGADFVSLIRNADAAMYLAKKQGRNNFQFFKPELTSAAQERLLLENSLRQALAGNELRLHYQPQFDAGTGRVVGVEALARWHHPRRGWISPAQFIPVAEESGLIEQLGAWALRTACAQNRQWQDSGYTPVRMAVNVSGRQFRQPDFIELVDRVLAETGLDPRWLEVEVTENIVMENVHETILTLTDLKARRISLAIDDFGTGYSSLSYLRQFPIDRLKIDRSFVADITRNADDAAIASAVISLARTLNLQVVAEGVETAEQALFLRERQCDALQGYYFGRPSPPEELLPLLEKVCV